MNRHCRKTLSVLGSALLLSACSAPDDPAQLGPDQQRQLDDAAEMLDANSVAFDPVDNGGEQQ